MKSLFQKVTYSQACEFIDKNKSNVFMFFNGKSLPYDNKTYITGDCLKNMLVNDNNLCISVDGQLVSFSGNKNIAYKPIHVLSELGEDIQNN